MSKLITEEQLEEMAQKLVKKHPHRTNPGIGGRGCKYTTLVTREHCLVGQIIVEFGGKVPGALNKTHNSLTARSMLRDFDTGLKFEEEAIWKLGQMQREADTGVYWVNAVKYAFQ